MATADGERCETCRFYDPDSDEDGSSGDGRCRRAPPTTDVGRTLLHALRLFRERDKAGEFDVPFDQLAEEDRVMAVEWIYDINHFAEFPRVMAYEWCGEYQPRNPLPVVPTCPAVPEFVPVSPTLLSEGDTAAEWRSRWEVWEGMRDSAMKEAIGRLAWPPGPHGYPKQIKDTIEHQLRRLGESWYPPHPGRLGFDWRKRFMPPADTSPHIARIRGADTIALLRAELHKRSEGTKIAAYVAAVIAANTPPTNG